MFLDDPATAIFDINLAIQVALIICLVVGSILRGIRKRHGVIMGIGTLANLATSVLIMVPALVRDWGDIVAAPLDPSAFNELAHATLGTITIIVALVFLGRFLLELRAKQPLRCGTVWSMRIVLVLWLVSFGFGVLVYFAA